MVDGRGRAEGEVPRPNLAKEAIGTREVGYLRGLSAGVT